MNECRDHRYQVEGEFTSVGCPYCRIEELKRELAGTKKNYEDAWETLSNIAAAGMAELERLREENGKPNHLVNRSTVDLIEATKQQTAREIEKIINEYSKDGRASTNHIIAQIWQNYGLEG